jgi:6-pyruvoyltetrahydropterin/6-carboxytetrahydropterin synthase
MHGHTWTVRVCLSGEPDPVFGWSHNLYEVNAAFDEVRRQVDHKYLNDVEGLAYPTLENLARWLWTQLDSRLSGVDRVVLTRGSPGQMEGCVYARPEHRNTDVKTSTAT